MARACSMTFVACDWYINLYSRVKSKVTSSIMQYHVTRSGDWWRIYVLATFYGDRWHTDADLFYMSKICDCDKHTLRLPYIQKCSVERPKETGTSFSYNITTENSIVALLLTNSDIVFWFRKSEGIARNVDIARRVISHPWRADAPLQWHALISWAWNIAVPLALEL